MIQVLFVCLGNICRSPMAEGLFLHHVKQAGLDGHIRVDSCGTSGWHIGELPDPRMRATASRHGVTLPSRSRQLMLDDFRNFHYIVPMDQSNLEDVLRLQKRVDNNLSEVYLMRHFDELEPGAEVPDPYWGGDHGFEAVFHILDRSTKKLLDYIVEQHSLSRKA